MTRGFVRAVAACAALMVVPACTSHRPPRVAGAPAFPAYTLPDVPPALPASLQVRAGHEAAWERLQSGDVGGATRAFTALLEQAPDFYPAETGLGFAYLVDRQFKSASTRFKAAIASNDRYLPAWLGESEAELLLNNDADAIAAMERVLTLDPQRTEIRSRLDLVRAREVQTLIEAGLRARLAGRFDDARLALDRAATLSPSSGVVFVELARTRAASGDLDGAERDARRAIALDPAEAQAYSALADVLQARGQDQDAAAALLQAAAIDPRPEWRDRAAALRARVASSAIPVEFRDIDKAATINRVQAAAFISMKLEAMLEQAPRRVLDVATDIRTLWAAPFILRVTQAGVMEVQPNHTFQPTAVVRRGDLAQIAAQLVTLIAPSHAAEVARWRASRPRFSDLAATNVFYRAAALSVAAGAMRTEADDRFDPTRPATGAELAAVVARFGQLAP